MYELHVVPNKDDIEKNRSAEPEGERIRAELVDFLSRNKISSIYMDIDEHCVDIGIAKLPPRIKPVLTLWGSIYIKVEAGE